MHRDNCSLAARSIAVIGAGGHARETLLLLRQCGVRPGQIAGFFVDSDYWRDETIDGYPQWRLNMLDPDVHHAVVAIGDSILRRQVVGSLPPGTRFPSFVHPSAIVPDDFALDAGVIVHAGCIITCNVTIGRHVQLNRSTNIGHDSVLHDFVTTAPGVVISGNCTIGAASYLGAMSCVREKQEVGAGSLVGMGAIVVTDIPDRATYCGNPARALARPAR